MAVAAATASWPVCKGSLPCFSAAGQKLGCLPAVIHESHSLLSEVPQGGRVEGKGGGVKVFGADCFCYHRLLKMRFKSNVLT